VYRNRQPKNCQFSGIAGIVDVKAMPINSVSMSETIWRRTHVDEFPWLFERKFRVSCQKAPRSHRLVGEGVSWKLSDRGGYEPTHGRGVLITRRSQVRVLPLLIFVCKAPLSEGLRCIWPQENQHDPQSTIKLCLPDNPWWRLWRRFPLYRRGKIFYCQFYNPKTGKFLSGRSTGQTNRNAARLIVCERERNGIPDRGGVGCRLAI